MKKIFMLLTLLVGMTVYVAAQKAMDPPKIMVVPDNIFCQKNGYMAQSNHNGVAEQVPDYEKALLNDETLHDVLIKVAQLITDRNDRIVIIDLLQAIDNMKKDATLSSTNGGDQSESIDEAIIRNSAADILVKVQYGVVKTGPQYRITYTITGVDAYTSQAFAPIQGDGKPSTSSDPARLLHEAVYSNMDAFLTKVMSYYNNMVTNGRMVAFDFKITGTSALRMNSKINQYTLLENIDDIVYENSVNGGGASDYKSGDTFMKYTGVYIPLTGNIRGRIRPQTVAQVAQRIVNELEQKGVTASYKCIGLGKVNIFIK